MQLLAVAAADEIDFGTLQFDQLRIERGEDAAEGQLDVSIAARIWRARFLA